MPGHERFPGLSAISFDFGNTLVPVGRADLRSVVERMTTAVIERDGGLDREAFRAAWAEERERQFAEEVPRLREVDLDRRVVRVLARLRGMDPPPRTGSWDDVAASQRSTPAEVAFAVDAYSRAFVALVPAPAEVGPLLERLAERFHLAVLSNWPLAVHDRCVRRRGRLAAVPAGRRRVPAGRHDQAGSADLPGRRDGAGQRGPGHPPCRR